MSDVEPTPDKAPAGSREEELARKAAQLLKASKPQLRRLMDVTRPRAQQMGQEAARYVREHETELKDAATRVALSRLTGPLGMAANALAQQLQPAQQQALTTSICPSCSTANHPSAKFCNECGGKLPAADAAQQQQQ